MSKTVEEQINVFLCNVQESVKAAYFKGYATAKKEVAAEAQEREYKRGLDDAEKAIHLLCLAPDDGGLNCGELERIFEYANISDILKRYTMNEIAIRIKEYENRQKKADDEIHVGDEVYCLNPTHKYVVLGFLDNGKIFVFSGRGLTGAFPSNQVHKTGRKYPIMEILEKLNQLNESEG